MGALGGLSGPFSRRGAADCGRCAREVEATLPWRGWSTLRRIWLAWICVLVASAPLYMGDAHGLLPAAIIMVFAIGPLNALAAIEPTCLTCGAVVRPRPRSRAR